MRYKKKIEESNCGQPNHGLVLSCFENSSEGQNLIAKFGTVFTLKLGSMLLLVFMKPFHAFTQVLNAIAALSFVLRAHDFEESVFGKTSSRHNIVNVFSFHVL